MRLLQLVGGCQWVAVLRRGHWVAVLRRGHWSGRPAQHSVFRRCGVATHATPICARSIIAGDIYVNVVKKATEPLRRSARWPTQARAQPARPAPTLAARSGHVPQAAGAIKHSQRCALFSPRPCARAATQTWKEGPGGSARRPTEPWQDAAGPGLRRDESFRPARGGSRAHVYS